MTAIQYETIMRANPELKLPDYYRLFPEIVAEVDRMTMADLIAKRTATLLAGQSSFEDYAPGFFQVI